MNQRLITTDSTLINPRIEHQYVLIFYLLISHNKCSTLNPNPELHFVLHYFYNNYLQNYCYHLNHFRYYHLDHFRYYHPNYFRYYLQTNLHYYLLAHLRYYLLAHYFFLSHYHFRHLCQLLLQNLLYLLCSLIN